MKLPEQTMTLHDCDVLGRAPERTGSHVHVAGYVMIPREKFWRYWLLAGVVRLFGISAKPSPLNERMR
jgi:hypothetical protein